MAFARPLGGSAERRLKLPCQHRSRPLFPRPSGGGPQRALKSLRGGGLASLRGCSAEGRWPVLRPTRIFMTRSTTLPEMQH
eukprot:7373080-Alexandrium_andersonii.AAC.1